MKSWLSVVHSLSCNGRIERGVFFFQRIQFAPPLYPRLPPLMGNFRSDRWQRRSLLVETASAMRTMVSLSQPHRCHDNPASRRHSDDAWKNEAELRNAQFREKIIKEKKRISFLSNGLECCARGFLLISWYYWKSTRTKGYCPNLGQTLGCPAVTFSLTRWQIFDPSAALEPLRERGSRVFSIDTRNDTRNTLTFFLFLLERIGLLAVSSTIKKAGQLLTIKAQEKSYYTHTKGEGINRARCRMADSFLTNKNFFCCCRKLASNYTIGRST